LRQLIPHLSHRSHLRIPLRTLRIPLRTFLHLHLHLPIGKFAHLPSFHRAVVDGPNNLRVRLRVRAGPKLCHLELAGVVEHADTICSSELRVWVLVTYHAGMLPLEECTDTPAIHHDSRESLGNGPDPIPEI
jgi:hypothetical protein